jgi:eukaryotic-like serine/threonine-protein kinase
MPSLLRFGPFELNFSTAELHRDGRKVRLPEQQFQILEMLLFARGNLVARDEIRKRLWPNDTVVEFDRSINAAIKKLRAALEDSADAPRFIETVARRGYRILVDVQYPEGEPPSDSIRRTVDGPLVGHKVSHFRVLTLLGGGGMGLVYKAEDLKLNRPVALKVLGEELASDFLAVQRFEREARAASALNHPNICTIYGVEENANQPFIVMELLEGESLRELVARYERPGFGTSQMPLQRLLEIAVQIATGLQAAHEKGIVHRDIKPANIFVTSRGQVKILDFGLAKVAITEKSAASDSQEDGENIDSQATPRRESSIELSLTRAGTAMGTAGYMSPEQVRGEKLDARTDLFSFGLVLFEMATGQRAFSGDTAAIIQDATLHRALPPASELNPELHVKLEEIIRKALEKNRELRYQTASEMLADLKTINAVARELATAVPPAASHPPLPDSRRSIRSGHRGKVFAAIALLILVGSVGFLWRYFRPFPPTEVKERQLTANSGDNPIGGAAISGDGKYLGFADNVGLHVRSLETGETRDIPNPAQFGDAHVFWSIHWFPDSTRFLAVSHPFSGWNRVITWEASVMGGELHKFRDDVEAWDISPDGLTVAMTKADEREVWRMRELWVMGLDGSNPRKLLDAGDLGNLESVRWSPDGTKLLYLKHDETTRRSIEIQDVRSSASHVVFSDPQLRDLYWLRDGRVVYAMAQRGANDQTCNYWVTRINEQVGAFASAARPLTDYRGVCIEDTSATADSKKLVFAKRSNEGGVYVADVEADSTRITPPKHLSMTESMESPNGWTADSREVVFTSNRDDKVGIYRMPLSGGQAKPVLVEETGRFGFPRPSPDGGWLLIERLTPGTVPGTHVDLLRVPMTGGPEEFIASDISGTPHCAAPSIALCAYSKKENDGLVFMSFDPQLKQRHELGHFKYLDPKGFYDWALSPDATRIAILQITTGNIYLLDLKTHVLRHIIVKHWNNLINMDWTSDGKGLFMASLQPGAVLLHVDLHGNVKVLWEPGGDHMIWALSSPDGKHLAMSFFSTNVNVWMMENF